MDHRSIDGKSEGSIPTDDPMNFSIPTAVIQECRSMDEDYQDPRGLAQPPSLPIVRFQTFIDNQAEPDLDLEQDILSPQPLPRTSLKCTLRHKASSSSTERLHTDAQGSEGREEPGPTENGPAAVPEKGRRLRRGLRFAKECAAEMACSFIFLFTIMAMSVNALKLGQVITTAEPALATAFCAAAVLYGFGPVSGAHFNPAVSLAVALSGNMPLLKAAAYILVQLLAGVIAAAWVNFLYGQDFTVMLIMKPLAGLSHTILMECTLSCILCGLVLVCAFGKGQPSAAPYLAIGFTHGFLVLISGSVSGGAFNPARVFGPAFYMLDGSAWSHLWKYWLGEFSGAVLAALLWRIAGAMPWDSASAVNKWKPLPLFAL